MYDKKINLFIFLMLFALTACSTQTNTVNEENWEVSPTFSGLIDSPDGKHDVVLRGTKGKVAFIDTTDFAIGKKVKTRCFFGVKN